MSTRFGAVATILVLTLGACSSTTTPTPSPSADAATDAAAAGDGGTKCEAAGHFCAGPDGTCPAGYAAVGGLEVSCNPVSVNCCIKSGSADAATD